MSRLAKCVDLLRRVALHECAHPAELAAGGPGEPVQDGLRGAARLRIPGLVALLRQVRRSRSREANASSRRSSAASTCTVE